MKDEDLYISHIFIFILLPFEHLYKWWSSWYSLFMTMDWLHLLLCIYLIVKNCLQLFAYSIFFFFFFIFLVPIHSSQTWKRIIKLSEHNTVFHPIKHIKRPYLFTPYHLPPCSSPPWILYATLPIWTNYLLDQLHIIQGFPFTSLLRESLFP